MKIRPMSDLHLEFHKDGGESFVRELDPAGCDVLVLAGDIASARALPGVLALFERQFPGVKIVYVPGNHEHYGTKVGDLRALLKELPSSIRVLDNAAVEIDGVRFVGATMWFASHPSAPTWALSDFQCIHGDFPTWVQAENARSDAFLRETVRAGDVVVTHHLPSWKSVAPQYAGDPFNLFFVHDMEDLIERAKPAVWIHGHTHSPSDYLLGSTRIVCNPFGYLRRESHAGFDEHNTLEIGP